MMMYGSHVSKGTPIDLSNSTMTFPQKLFALMENESVEVVRWVSHGFSFRIMDVERFSQDVVPRYFKQSKMTSFQRQLNLYGFRRITKGENQGSYFHPKFQRDRRDLLNDIKRLPEKGTLASIEEVITASTSLPSERYRSQQQNAMYGDGGGTATHNGVGNGPINMNNDDHGYGGNSGGAGLGRAAGRVGPGYPGQLRAGAYRVSNNGFENHQYPSSGMYSNPTDNSYYMERHETRNDRDGGIIHQQQQPQRMFGAPGSAGSGSGGAAWNGVGGGTGNYSQISRKIKDNPVPAADERQPKTKSKLTMNIGFAPLANDSSSSMPSSPRAGVGMVGGKGQGGYGGYSQQQQQAMMMRIPANMYRGSNFASESRQFIEPSSALSDHQSQNQNLGCENQSMSGTQTGDDGTGTASDSSSGYQPTHTHDSSMQRPLILAHPQALQQERRGKGVDGDDFRRKGSEKSLNSLYTSQISASGATRASSKPPDLERGHSLQSEVSVGSESGQGSGSAPGSSRETGFGGGRKAASELDLFGLLSDVDIEGMASTLCGGPNGAAALGIGVGLVAGDVDDMFSFSPIVDKQKGELVAAGGALGAVGSGARGGAVGDGRTREVGEGEQLYSSSRIVDDYPLSLDEPADVVGGRIRSPHGEGSGVSMLRGQSNTLIR